jgi:hypothetical protein
VRHTIPDPTLVTRHLTVLPLVRKVAVVWAAKDSQAFVARHANPGLTTLRMRPPSHNVPTSEMVLDPDSFSQSCDHWVVTQAQRPVISYSFQNAVAYPISNVTDSTDNPVEAPNPFQNRFDGDVTQNAARSGLRIRIKRLIRVCRVRNRTIGVWRRLAQQLP